jgi:leader peptidase (prepilin peptidase)/N-methyltransferase
MPHLTAIDLARILLIATLLYLAYIDLRTFRLPDALTFPLIASGLLFNGLLKPAFCDFSSALAGVLIAYGFLWGLNRLYKFTKNQNGIGLGDAKLLAGLGAWFGWIALPGLLLIASVSGLIGGLLWIRYHKANLRSAFPFGPFLAFAGIIELLWPHYIQTLILSNPT